jgi:hypothetical protein
MNTDVIMKEITENKNKFGLFIISYNRLTALKETLTFFQEHFNNNDIFIIDKGSDSEQLLNYYSDIESEGLNIIYSDPMIGGADGIGGLNDLHKEIDKYTNQFNFYAVTDPDISLEGCDADLLEVYASFLEIFPDIDIVGPMLKIDDIPMDYPAREWCFRRHVDQFWSKKPECILIKGKKVYFQKAKIDSTFGLLRSGKSFERLLDGVRVYNPYEAKHLDWYITPSTMSADQQNYMQTSNKLISHWGAKNYKTQPFHKILSENERLIFVSDGKCVRTRELPAALVKYVGFRNFFIGMALILSRVSKAAIAKSKRIVVYSMRKFRIADNGE